MGRGFVGTSRAMLSWFHSVTMDGALTRSDRKRVEKENHEKSPKSVRPMNALIIVPSSNYRVVCQRSMESLDGPSKATTMQHAILCETN